MNPSDFLFSPLADAIGHTLLFSIGQAFVIFICLRIILKCIPNVLSHVKYALSYCAYLAIGVWFFITLIRQYSIAKNEGLVQHSIAQNIFNQGSLNSLSHSSTIFSFSFLNEYLPLIVIFYFIGIAWYSFRFSINLFKANRLKSQCLYELDPEWKQHITRLANCMNIRSSLRTFFSSRINTPVMVGFLKPVILLPFTTMNQLTTEQFEAIILHELAHICRNDYLLNIIQSIIDTVLFFNPFTWWITKYIREEREKSCDEMVLQFSDPFHYARALLSLEEPLAKQPLMMSAVNKRSHLFHRIKNIMEMKNNQLNLRQKLFTLLVISIATISVAWLSPGENNSAQFEKNNISANQKKDSGMSFFTLMNFHQPDDSTPPPPPAPPAAPLPPVAMAPNGIPVLPAAPLPPSPPLAPLPPTSFSGKINDSIPGPDDYFNSKEWKQQQEAIKKSSEKMRKYFQSDAWKKQQDLIHQNAMVIKKYFNSPEWKKQQELIKKNAEKMNEYFNSPEWKKQQELIKKNAEFNKTEWKKQMELLKKSGEEMKKYFNSPEWKKQQEQVQHMTDSLSAYFRSDEWQKQQKNLQEVVAQTQRMLQSKFQQNLKGIQEKQSQAQENAHLKNK